MTRMTFVADPLEGVIWPLNFVGAVFVKCTMPAWALEIAVSRLVRPLSARSGHSREFNTVESICQKAVANATASAQAAARQRTSRIRCLDRLCACDPVSAI